MPIELDFTAAPAAPSASRDGARSPAGRSRPGGGLGRAMRTQAMVLAFYLVDTLFMLGLAVIGALPVATPLLYGVSGCGLTVVFAGALALGLHRRMGGVRFTLLQLLSACGLLLVTAAGVPQIGMLMLPTVVVAVATAALQLPLRHVLAVCGVVAVTAVALLLVYGNRFGAPLDDTAARLVSGLWFTVTLGKIAAISLVGTQTREALAASNAELAQALTKVRELSERDDLTGLHNRRCILVQLADERARFARGGAPFAVALLDLDHFKRVNDRFGHAVGDEVLRVFAQAVVACLRTTDRVARYGGEEFLLMLPDTPDASAAALAAERVRRAVRDHPWADVAPGLAVTCSIGISISGNGEGVAELLERADAALYRAKSDGRDAIRVG